MRESDIKYLLINIYEELDLDNQTVVIKKENSTLETELHIIMGLILDSDLEGMSHISKEQFVQALNIYVYQNAPKGRIVDLITNYFASLKI